MAHCLVTGGAGFIGAHLAEGLLRRGHRVRVLDNFSTGAQTNVRAVQAQVAAEGLAGSLEVVDGSILDQQTLARAMHGIEYVFHEAALPSVVRDVRPTLLILTNVFRDQLDRFAEPERVARLLRGSAGSLPSGATVVANADDPVLWGAVEDLEPVGFSVRAPTSVSTSNCWPSG